MKKVIILCAHEPKKDPRVELVANSIANNYETTVIAAGYSIKHDSMEQVSKNLYIKQIACSMKQINILFTPYWKYCIPALLFLILYSTLISIRKLMNLFIKLIFRLFTNRGLPSFKKFFNLKPKTSAINLGLVARIHALRWTLTYFVDIYKVFKNNIPNNINCIYVNDLDTLMPAVVYKQSNPACKIIYDCHEFYPYSHQYPPVWYVYILKSLERNLIKHVDEVLTVNPLLAEVIGKQYNVKVHSQLNASPYLVRESIEKSDFSRLKKRFNFLFQGSFRSEDGIAEIVDAWEELNPRDAALFLRAIDSPYKDVAMQTFSTYKTYNKSLFFIEPVIEEELIEAAMSFDVGIISYKPIDYNYKYCCPNKLNQYMHSGLAIMANNTEFVASVINTNNLGIIYDSTKKNSIKEAIQKFINDSTFTNECKKRSMLFAMDHFNWQLEERKILALIGSIL